MGRTHAAVDAAVEDSWTTQFREAEQVVRPFVTDIFDQCSDIRREGREPRRILVPAGWSFIFDTALVYGLPTARASVDRPVVE